MAAPPNPHTNRTSKLRVRAREDDEGGQAAPTAKRVATGVDAGVLSITTQAWVSARPADAVAARVPRKVDGRAGRWLILTAGDAEHEARWTVVRRAVEAGRLGYLAGATTGARVGAYASGKHAISVYVGDGDDTAAHRAVLAFIRGEAGVHDTLYFKPDGGSDSRFFCRAGATAPQPCDGQRSATATTAPTAAPMARSQSPGRASATASGVVVAVTGSRNWTRESEIRAALEALPAELGVARGAITLVHGDCRGADRLAASAAQALGMRVVAEPARWDTEGAAAGPNRNRRMLDTWKPRLVLAFADSLDEARGTASCMSEARKRNIPVRAFGRCGGEAAPSGSGSGGPGGPGPRAPPSAASAPSAASVAATAALETMTEDDWADVLAPTAAAPAPASTAPTAPPPARVLRGLWDPNTVRVPTPAHHAAMVRPPIVRAGEEEAEAEAEADGAQGDEGSDTEGSDDDEPAAGGAGSDDDVATSIQRASAVARSPLELKPKAKPRVALKSLAAQPKPRAEWLTPREFYARFVVTTPEAAAAVETAAQGTPPWLRARELILTASTYGAAAGVSPYQTPAELLVDKLWGIFQGNDATRWGNAHEPHAREAFEAWFVGTWLKDRYAAAGLSATRYAEAAACTAFLEFGLIVCPATPWIGTSLDGLVVYLDVDGRLVMDLVEFKCPYYLAHTADHPYAKYPGNVPHQYNAQIQGSMGLLNAHPDVWRAIVKRKAAAYAATPPADTNAHAPEWAALLRRLEAPSTSFALRQAWFTVWQPAALWVSQRAYDDAFFTGTLFPALKAWYFGPGGFLTAATHKCNGRLAWGQASPAHTIVSGARTDAELAAESLDLAALASPSAASPSSQSEGSASAASADSASEDEYPQWGPEQLLKRLETFAAARDPGTIAAFASEVDSRGLRKLEALRRSVKGALAKAEADSEGEMRERIFKAWATLVGDAGVSWLAGADAATVHAWIAADPCRALAAVFGDE